MRLPLLRKKIIFPDTWHKNVSILEYFVSGFGTFQKQAQVFKINLEWVSQPKHSTRTDALLE